MSGPMGQGLTGLAALLSRIRIAILLVCALVAWGMLSLYNIRKESWPDVEVPMGLVTVVYPGAPAYLVEGEVTNLLEAELKGLPALSRLDSSSIQHAALLLVEFDIDADMRESIDALRDRVDIAEAGMPDGVSSVTVEQIGTSNQPVYSFSLSGDYPPEVLRAFALTLRDRLEGLEGVSEIRLSGLREDQLQVLVQQRALEEIGGTLYDVVDALQKSQVTTPLGRFQSTERNYSLDVDRLGLDISQLSRLMVRAKATGDNVPLSTVATLQRDLAEPSEHTRVVTNTPEGVIAGDAISFDILRQPGADVPKLVRRVEAALDESRHELPADLAITVTTNRGEEIIEGLELLFSNGAQAVLLVFVILFLVLGVRESIIAGLSIPLTFLAVFGVLLWMDQSVNNLSLMALVIALGLLVDDFILIMEGMHEELEQGNSALQSAVNTLKNFAVPSLSGSLTTLAAFFPIAMLGGLEGKFIQVIPLTICISLITSYLVSITIDSSFGAALLRHHRPNVLTAKVNDLFDALVRYYEARVFPRTLVSPRQRTVVLLSTAGAFGLSLLAAAQLEMIVYPASDESQLGATFTLPPGTTLDETIALSAEVEALLSGDPVIQHFTLNAGMRSGLAMSGPSSFLEPFTGEHILGVTMQLVPREQRDLPSYDLAEVYREKLAGLGRGQLELHQIRMGAASGAPVEIEIKAGSVRRAEDLAAEVREIASTVPGLIGLKDTRKPHQGAFSLELSDEALAFHNLDRGSVLRFLFYAISGTTADTVYDNGEEVDIEVGYDWREDGVWNSPASLEEVLSLKVPTFIGSAVPLAGVASLEHKTTPVAINHTNRRHVVTISADSEGSPVEAADAIEALLDEGDVQLQLGESIRFLGDKANSATTMRELFKALLLAISLIFSILVVQFRSFLQPFIILITMPLALTGVFFGFLASTIPVSFPAMIGMVALAGIVVNDSIVLIDAINRGRWDDGLDTITAVKQGCTSRMRPIMVTTVTTVIGLIPLALTDPVWEGLCMAIVFGISLATVLTMVVIPAIYMAIEGAGDATPVSVEADTENDDHP